MKNSILLLLLLAIPAQAQDADCSLTPDMVMQSETGMVDELMAIQVPVNVLDGQPAPTVLAFWIEDVRNFPVVRHAVADPLLQVPTDRPVHVAILWKHELLDWRFDIDVQNPPTLLIAREPVGWQDITTLAPPGTQGATAVQWLPLEPFPDTQIPRYVDAITVTINWTNALPDGGADLGIGLGTTNLDWYRNEAFQTMLGDFKERVALGSRDLEALSLSHEPALRVGPTVSTGAILTEPLDVTVDVQADLRPWVPWTDVCTTTPSRTYVAAPELEPDPEAEAQEQAEQRRVTYWSVTVAAALVMVGGLVALFAGPRS